MALKATIYKANLQISDMGRHYYDSHELTIARHPSENDERMMIRLLVFALNANTDLAFTKGLSTDNEPDLWEKNLSGEIEHWLELGQPEEKRLKQASGKSKKVSVYTYSGNSADIWWQQQQKKLAGIKNLSVFSIASDQAASLTELTERSMQLQCTIEDGNVWLSNENKTVEVTPVKLL